MSFLDLFVENPGGKLCLRSIPEGRPVKTPSQRVLAFHGWMDHAGSFDLLAPELHVEQFKALDFSGHGRSAHRPDGAFYHFADWVSEGFAALRWLHWERAVVLGHSMGAGVACLLAATFPERVERLILIEGLGPLTDPPEKAPELLRTSLTYRLKTEPPVYPSKAAAVERLQKRGISYQGAQALAGRVLAEVEGGYSFTVDPRLRLPSRTRLSEPQVLAFMERIEAPTLLILGEQGLKFPEAPLRRRIQAIPDITVEMVPGGHHPHLDEPRAVAEAINGFL